MTDVSPLLDFRCLEDDAWYCVRLRLDGDILRIMYCNFSEAYDEFHCAAAFPDSGDLDAFRRRFRQPSSQLQDKNCAVVAKGTMVCASYAFAGDDLRFYDAIVKSVNPSIHPLQGECQCKFELQWLHGPHCGKNAIVGIERVCLLKSQATVVNMTLQAFLNIAEEKLKKKEYSSDSKLSNCASNLAQFSQPDTNRQGFSQKTPSPCASQICSSAAVHHLKKPHQYVTNSMRALKVQHSEKNKARGKVIHEYKNHDKKKIHFNVPQTSESEAMESICSESRLEQDFDMGGEPLCMYENFQKKKSCYFCRVDNLEKDLSSSIMMHFLKEHLGISCLVFICPSTSYEFFTRGFILVEEEHLAHKLMDFLLNSEYFIVSSRGRPWVIDATYCGIVEGKIPAYEVEAQQTNCGEEQSVEIKLVHKGTAEHEKIRKMHSLHLEFQEHINFRLLRTLLADERRLMQLGQ